jgi:hypothetical protein
MQIMGQIGFNCQLPLSEIGLTTDSSHSTWFHKTARFSRSKSSRFSMQKIWLSMFYSIQVGEEPDTDQPPLLAPKILPFPKELEFHLFSISIQEFLCVFTPLWDPEKWTNSFS